MRRPWTLKDLDKVARREPVTDIEWKKKRGHPEQDFHVTVAEYLDRALPPNVMWTTVGHGGFKLPIWVASLLKRMGLHPGWPDIQLIHPETGVYHGLELKAPGGTVHSDQRAIHNGIMNSHARVTVCRTLDQVDYFLRAHGFPVRTSALLPRN